MPYTCLNCLGEPTLRQRAVPFCIHQTVCTYCSATGSHAEIKDIAGIFAEVFEIYFQTSANSTWHQESDVWPEGEYFIDIIENYGGVKYRLAKDLGDCLKTIWEDNSDHLLSELPPGPYFEPVPRSTKHVSMKWSFLKSNLQENRFYNEDVREVLEDIFGNINSDCDANGNSVIVEAGPEKSICSVYRARMFQDESALEKALSHPEREFGPPPTGIGVSGRMNAQGQSVFYCATDQQTTISEVRAPVGCIVAIVKFNIIRPLRLLDLNRLQSVELPENASIFDPNTNQLINRLAFLWQIEHLISMPVLPDHQHRDYLITQVISDYLACSKHLNIDGIIYRSAQTNGKKGRNIVIFGKSCIVANSKSEQSTAQVQMYALDRGNIILRPQIEYKKPDPNKINIVRRNCSLELDRQSIQLHKIERVKYFTKSIETSISK